MKKLILMLIVLISLGSAFATLLNEGFEGTTFPPADWTAPATAWQRYPYYCHSGVAAAGSGCSSDTWWLVTPKLKPIAGANTLTFWYRDYDASSYWDYTNEYTYVMVSTTTDFSAATTLWTGNYLTFTTTWQQASIDLSAYNGQEIFIAFKSIHTNGNYRFIDDVTGVDLAPAVIPPNPAFLGSPANGGTNILQIATLNWASGGGVPAGYKLYFGITNGDTNPPWNIENGTDMGTSLTYDPIGNMSYSQTYYWKIVPYNAHGNATNCPVWSFTTRPDATVTPDYYQDFSTWPALNWIQYNYLYGGTPIPGDFWDQDDWLNVTTPVNKAAKINIFDIHNSWLVTPPVQIPVGDYELKFDLALMTWNSHSTPVTPGNQADDRLLIVMSDNPDMSNPTTLREWNNTGSANVFDNIPATGSTNHIPLTGISGSKYFAFYAESTNNTSGDNDLMVDNFSIHEVPPEPILVINPTSWDFGPQPVNGTATKQFIMGNNGTGVVALSSVVVTGTYFTLTVPPADMNLSAGETTTFTVQYAPTAIGAHTGNVAITYGSLVTNIPLSGSVAMQVTMFNGSTTLAVGESLFFYDSGGASAGYQDYENYVYTFYPPVGYRISAQFSAFSTQAYFDYLYAYDGNSISATQLGAYTGNLSPFTVMASEAMTFKFTANHTVHSDGWTAHISLVALPPYPPGPVALLYPGNSATGVQIAGLTLDWQSTGTGGVANYYRVYMSTDEDPIANNEFYWETPYSYLNTDGTNWEIAGNQRYYWTVVGVSNLYGAGLLYPSPFNFQTALEVQFAGIGLHGVINNDTINLSWAPFDNDGTLNWDSGVHGWSLGLNEGGTFSVAARFTSPMLTAYAGQYVTALKIYIGNVHSTITLKAWTGDDANISPNLEIFSQVVPTTVVGWYNITIPGIAIPATGSLWLGYEATNAERFPAGCDSGPALDYFGDLICVDGEWSSLHAQISDLNVNWNIQGTVTPTPSSKGIAKLLSIPMVQGKTSKTNRAVLSARLSNNNHQASSRFFHGYNVYRNNVLLNPAPINVLTYIDSELAPGVYAYRVEAVYTSSNLASNNWTGEIMYIPPLALPFTETWDSGSYLTQSWITTNTGWYIDTFHGVPLPCASFSWMPQVNNYESYLSGYPLAGTGHSNVWVSFELSLYYPYYFPENSSLSLEVWDGSAWNSVHTWSSSENGGEGWEFEYLAYDISTWAAGHDFKIRFKGWGDDDYHYNNWYLDNINVYEMPATLAAPVTDVSFDGTNVLLEWTSVPGATWYGVYRGTEPNGPFTYLGWSPASYNDALFTPAAKEFYKVTAGAGTLPAAPTRGRRFNAPAIEVIRKK